jgi:hypothetical protein
VRYWYGSAATPAQTSRSRPQEVVASAGIICAIISAEIYFIRRGRSDKRTPCIDLDRGEILYYAHCCVQRCIIYAIVAPRRIRRSLLGGEGSRIKYPIMPFNIIFGPMRCGDRFKIAISFRDQSCFRTSEPFVEEAASIAASSATAFHRTGLSQDSHSV